MEGLSPLEQNDMSNFKLHLIRLGLARSGVYSIVFNFTIQCFNTPTPPPITQPLSELC